MGRGLSSPAHIFMIGGMLMNFGYEAGILITDTTAVTGVFRAIQVLADATFTTLTSDIKKNGTSLISTGPDFGTVPSGVVLYGTIKAVTLATGKVMLYK